MSNSEKVLKNIFRLVDVKSLKIARIVNKSWEELARVELLHRNSLGIRINSVNFGKILKSLQNSQELPTNEFYFAAENLELGKVEEFLEFASHHVKTLTIQFDSIDPFSSYSKLENHLVLIRGCVFVERIFLDPYFKWYQQENTKILVDTEKQKSNKQKKKKKKKKAEKQNNKPKDELNESSPFFEEEDMIKLPHLKQLSFLVTPDQQNDLAMTRNSIGFKLLMGNLETLKIADNFWLRCGSGGVLSNSNNNNQNDNNKNKNMEKLMREFWSQPKLLELFKSFHFNRKLIRLADLQNFADAEPKLQLISLFDFQDKQSTTGIKNELYRIFQSSQNSLEILESASFFRLPDPRLPQLNNLTTLVLSIDSSQNLEHYFPDVHHQSSWSHLRRYNSLDEKVPRLKTVRLLLNLEWNGKFSDHWTRYSSSSNSSRRNGKGNGETTQFTKYSYDCFNSVENLELTGNDVSTSSKNGYDWGVNMNCGWWERVGDLFPQVKRITVKQTTQLCLILPRIFSLWPELKCLRVWIPLGRVTESHLFYFLGGDRSKYLQMDSTFTGLPHQVVQHQRQLFSSSFSVGQGNGMNNVQMEDKILKIETVNQMRNSSPSLCNLTGLEKLECVFVGNYSEVGLLSWKCPLSIVSCLYAFSLLPDLNVRICYDKNHVNSQELRRNLESMSSFGVKFGDIPSD